MKDLFKNNPAKLFFIAGSFFSVVLVLVGIASFMMIPKQSDVVATVGEEKIYLTEYRRALFAATNSGTPEAPTKLNDMVKEPVLDGLIRLRVLKKEASRLGIAVDEAKVKEKAKTLYPAYEDATDSAKKAYEEAAVLSYLEEEVTAKVVSWKEGSFIACRFDRYIQDDYEGKEAEAQALLAKQQPYAKTYCEGVKARLESGAKYEDELAKIKADKTIGDESWKPFYMTLGGEFGKENFKKEEMILGTNMFQKIKELKNEKGVYLLEADSYKDSDDLKSNVPGMSAVVVLSGNGNDGETEDYEAWITEKINGSSVVKYLERIVL